MGHAFPVGEGRNVRTDCWVVQAGNWRADSMPTGVVSLIHPSSFPKGRLVNLPAEYGFMARIRSQEGRSGNIAPSS